EEGARFVEAINSAFKREVDQDGILISDRRQAAASRILRLVMNAAAHFLRGESLVEEFVSHEITLHERFPDGDPIPLAEALLLRYSVSGSSDDLSWAVDLLRSEIQGLRKEGYALQ